MSRRIALVTTSRSDYGPQYWLLHDLLRDPRFSAELVVGGAHLDARFGMTVTEIEADGLPIARRIPFLDEPTPAQAMSRAFLEFSRYLDEARPELVVLYADRVELLSFAIAAVQARVPIAHLCGGDITEGAVDEQVRHAITKLAHLHFPSTRSAGARVVQMGEEPWRVCVSGDPALDRLVRGDRAGLEELTELLGFSPDRSTLLVTLHPSTVSQGLVERETSALVAALASFDGPVVITAPAPDAGSETIQAAWDELVRTRPRTRFIPSLGSRRYRALLAVVGAVVGNSSSGIIEAASVPVPAVNIGERQAGRERARNVIDVPADGTAISGAIARALSESFRASLAGLDNPYGDGRSAARVIERLASAPPHDALLRKRFIEP